MNRGRLLILALVAGVLIAGPGAAQLSKLIENTNGDLIILDNPSHNTHFTLLPDGVDPNLPISNDDAKAIASPFPQVTGLAEALNTAIATQLSTFPVPSSAGGFTYEYNEATGTFDRASESFGPLFAERAQTAGKGRWNFGFSILQADYDELDGLGLDNGDLQFQVTHVDLDNSGDSLTPGFEGDLIGFENRISLETETAVVFFNYGVTNRFDFGVAVPYVSVDLSVSSLLHIDRLATGSAPGDLSQFHRFSPQDQFQGDPTLSLRTASGDASGLGDILVRLKYRFGESSAWAAAADVRLPTGDDDDLLGSGHTQTKLFLIGSTTWGQSFSPHINVGYTIASGSSDVIADLPDEIGLTVGFDVAAHPRLTFGVDVIGRQLQDAVTINRSQRAFQFCPFPSACPGDSSLIGSATRPDLTAQRDDIDLLLGSVGIRWNLVGNLLLSLNALIPLSDDGLTVDGVAPVIGLDYSF